MSDILKQIQALQEQFSNLFEVEGLGNPAVDVPPSQNKIKKDVKTKDGKAELVSVEDELFPYDGNKREQYRQKILDTINGMIQGTSTLEDLLQIVRQKKAPLKEAMEVLEELIGEGRKEGESQEEFKKRLAGELVDKKHSKYVDSLKKLIYSEKHDRKHGGVSDTTRKLDKQNRADFLNKDLAMMVVAGDTSRVHPNSKSDNQRRGEDYMDLKAEMRDSNKNEALEEAMEVLEELIAEKESYVFPKKAVEDGNKRYLEADKKNNEATRLARKGFEKLNKKIKELEGKGIDTDVDIEPGVTYGNGPKKEYQQALKTADALHNAQREADREETKARNNQRKLRAEGLKGVVMRHFDYVPTKKGDSFNIKKVLDKNEALEEALKILELFDRPDLLDDIDTALGSPVKKTFKKVINNVGAPKKEKKVKECKK